MKGDACKKKCFYNSGGICCYSGRDCEEAHMIANVFGRRRGSASIMLNILLAMIFLSLSIATIKSHQRTEQIVSAVMS